MRPPLDRRGRSRRGHRRGRWRRRYTGRRWRCYPTPARRRGPWRTARPFLTNGFSLLAVIGKRAHHNPPGRGVHGENHVRVAWQEDVRAAVVWSDDEHIIGPGLDQIGDMTDPVPSLVEDRESHHLIEKVLVSGERAGICAADSQRRAVQPLDGLGSRDA